MHRVKGSIKNTLWLASDKSDSARSDNVVNVVPQQMGMVVEEAGPYFHSGLTTCTHSSSRDLTLTPMQMSMPMPIIISISTITSTRYRLPGTLIASHPLTIISRITTTITTIIIQITTITIVIIIIIITITTTITIRFKSISISPEISVIETPVSVCKVTRKPESCFTECSSSFGLIYFASYLSINLQAARRLSTSPCAFFLMLNQLVSSFCTKFCNIKFFKNYLKKNTFYN